MTTCNVGNCAAWKRAAFFIAATCMAVVVVAGCGKGGNTLKAPGQAGTAQTLAGTSWVEPESKTEYSFPSDTQVEVTKPGLPEPLQGDFSINDKGIVDITVGLKTYNGTWDGADLTMEGKPLTKK